MTEPAYSEFPEFILGITETIWEKRNVASLRDAYADGIIVRSPMSVVTGNEDVIKATMATLAEFPDRQLLGEDVIWDRMGDRSWLSSHRIMSCAVHAGDGHFGKASGSRLEYRVLADCHAAPHPKWGWRIDDEWLVRDLGAIVRQIGVSPEDFAWNLVEKEGGPDACSLPYRPDGNEAPGPYRGTGNEEEHGLRYADMIGRIMDGDLAVVRREYDRACQVEFPGGGTGHGWDGAESTWLDLRAAFPGASFQVEHRMGRADPSMPPRAAVRWSLRGAHEGAGIFGPPSGADVHVMGICHAEYGPRGLKREFVLWDEVAIWKQIVVNR